MKTLKILRETLKEFNQAGIQKKEDNSIPVTNKSLIKFSEYIKSGYKKDKGSGFKRTLDDSIVESNLCPICRAIEEIKNDRLDNAKSIMRNELSDRMNRARG